MIFVSMFVVVNITVNSTNVEFSNHLVPKLDIYIKSICFGPLWFKSDFQSIIGWSNKMQCKPHNPKDKKEGIGICVLAPLASVDTMDHKQIQGI